MVLRSTGKKVPRSLSPKRATKTEGRFLRFIFNNKGTLGEDCKICKPLDGHVWEVKDKNRPIIPRLEPSRRSGAFTHPHCECRFAEVFADEAYAYEVTREEWENSTIQGKQQQLQLVGGPTEMATRSWATLPFALRQRLESLTANTNQTSLFSTKFDDINLNSSFGNEKSMSWNEATVNQKFTLLLDKGIPYHEAHFASKLPAQEAAVVLGADGNNSTDLLNDLLQGNIPNTKFMIDVQTPATKGFHPGGVEAELNDPLPLEPADNDPAGRDAPDGLMEQGDDPQVLEPTTTDDRRICPDDMVLKGDDCVPKDSDLVLMEGMDMYEKGLSYEQGVNKPLPLEQEDDDPLGRDKPSVRLGPDRGDGLNTGKKNEDVPSNEQTDDDKDEETEQTDNDKDVEKEKHMDDLEEQTDDDEDRPTGPAIEDPNSDEGTDNVRGLNTDKKDLSESELTRYFRKLVNEMAKPKVRATELPPCKPGSLLNPDSGECEEVIDVNNQIDDLADNGMNNGMDEAGVITEPSGTDDFEREAPLTFGSAQNLGEPTDAPIEVPLDDFPEETGMDIGLDEQQNGVMDGDCGPDQIKDSMGNCVAKQGEQSDDDDDLPAGRNFDPGLPKKNKKKNEQADNDNITETWATEADVCRCGEKAWNSAYEVYGANVPAIILSKLPDELGSYLLTDDKRRRLAGLEFSKLPPEIKAGALNLLQKYPAIVKKRR